MKQTRLLRQIIIVLFLTAFITGCAGTKNRESTGEYMDDSVITTKVKTAIFKDPMLKVFQINVETFKAEVQLSGFVNSAAASARAAEVAGAVKGVVSVKNSLVIK